MRDDRTSAVPGVDDFAATRAHEQEPVGWLTLAHQHGSGSRPQRREQPRQRSKCTGRTAREKFQLRELGGIHANSSGPRSVHDVHRPSPSSRVCSHGSHPPSRPIS
ncbi:Uncharacterised protein [Mycobacteroides abscessus subsp. massiliense]|nr:Uncharacterised protein [Mycobacteroides abscessus subsp. massiliense]